MENVSFNFAGKRALVTGAGRGFGRAIATALSKAGAETFALSRTKETLDSLVKEYPAIRPVCVDLTNWDETKIAVEQLGQIDLLVNNAAFLHHQLFLEVDKETISKTFQTNFESVINVSQIRVNSVHPTVSKTDMGDYWVDDEERAKLFKANTPQGRFRYPKSLVQFCSC